MIATTSLRRAGADAGARTLTRSLRTLTHCLVCGFREVRTDEVLERGMLLLNECPRCEHRWTERKLVPVASALRESEAPEAA